MIEFKIEEFSQVQQAWAIIGDIRFANVEWIASDAFKMNDTEEMIDEVMLHLENCGIAFTTEEV